MAQSYSTKHDKSIHTNNNNKKYTIKVAQAHGWWLSFGLKGSVMQLLSVFIGCCWLNSWRAAVETGCKMDQWNLRLSAEHISINKYSPETNVRLTPENVGTLCSEDVTNHNIVKTYVKTTQDLKVDFFFIIDLIKWFPPFYIIIYTTVKLQEESWD